MATISISTDINLVLPDGLEESAQTLIDSIESSIDAPLSSVSFSGLIATGLAALSDGNLSEEEVTVLTTDLLALGSSLGITEEESSVIQSNLEALVEVNNTLVTDDDLLGTASNDGLYGAQGNDTLTGTTADALGVGELDLMVGGDGSDTFVLGNTTSTFYNDNNPMSFGASDFAVIADFNPGQDTIQLSGNASDYALVDLTATFGIGGTGIFYNPGGSVSMPEVIGVVVGTNLTNFDSGFTFV